MPTIQQQQAFPRVDFSSLADLPGIYDKAKLGAARERVLSSLGANADPAQASQELFRIGDIEGAMTLGRLAEVAKSHGLAREKFDYERQKDYTARQDEQAALQQYGLGGLAQPSAGPPPPAGAVKGSWYSQAPERGFVDRQDRPNSNALGVPDSQQGIARPTRATLGQWFDVTAPNGQTYRLQQTDVGPAARTGRGVDISAAGVVKMGYTPQNFPTDGRFVVKPAPGPPQAQPQQAPPVGQGGPSELFSPTPMAQGVPAAQPAQPAMGVAPAQPTAPADAERAAKIERAYAMMQDARLPRPLQQAAAREWKLLTSQEAAAQKASAKEGPVDNPYYVPGVKTHEAAKDVGFATQAHLSEEVLQQLEKQGTEAVQKITSQIPLVGNYTVSPEYRQYEAAMVGFTEAHLRRVSGAAIQDFEYERAKKRFFPQPGDDAKTIAFKRRARAAEIKSISSGAGPGYKPPYMLDDAGNIIGGQQKAVPPAPGQRAPDMPVMATNRFTPAAGEGPQQDSFDGRFGQWPQGQPGPQGPAAPKDWTLANNAITSGLARGVTGLVGLPGDVGGLMKRGVDYLAGSPSPNLPGALPTAQTLDHAIERLAGPLYQPTSTLGRGASTVASFVPGALAGPGGPVRNIVNFAAIPGVASEAAGRATEGTPAEPWARAGAAVLAGGGAAVLNRPSPALGRIGQAMEGVTSQQLHDAERLFVDAQRAGIPISRPEAVQAVTNGATSLADLQRVVEGSGAMKGFYAGRQQQNEAAAKAAFGNISPGSVAPSMVGPSAGQAAEQAISDVRGTINRAAEPAYTAAETVRLSPQEFARIQAVPGFEEAARAVRGDPQLNRYVANLPDDSVGFLNEVKKYVDQSARNAAAPMAQNPNMQRAAGLSMDATTIRDAARQASPDYAQALATEEFGRRNFLEPLLRGPLGKIADRDTTTKQAIEALFPRNPLPNSQSEITDAVRALSRRSPGTAQILVRAHVESTFDQAARNLQGGANQWGGASFAAALRGNAQQAENLQAAIQALPNGATVWPGVDRFLQIMEAQGQRQRIGSQTAFNAEVQSALKAGTPIGEIATMAGGLLTKLPARIKEGFERRRLGSSVNELARVFTDPAAGPLFRQLASAKTQGQASTAMLKILNMATQSRTEKTK